jgi:glutamate---cysteine ligase / carboxylate-amine ligase
VTELAHGYGALEPAGRSGTIEQTHDETPLDGEALRAAFDHPVELTVAAEEELLLLDPRTFDLTPAAPGLFESLADAERYRQEISPAQIEIVSGICATSGEVRQQLAEGRRQAVAAAGGSLRLAGVGAHPFALPWSEIGSAPRYTALLAEHQLGARLGALAAGLHVHVAVRGADRALAVHNALRTLMPALVALSANAPYIAGVDSGLATVRCTLADALPRHGTGPAFPSWDDFAEALRWGRASGAVPDPSRFWWDCRLNTRTGTIEVRAPDAQAALDDAEALVAVVQAAVADLCARHDAGDPLPVHEVMVIEENRWRAARYGLDGDMVDTETERLRPARDVVGDLLDRLQPAAGRCGSAGGLALARALLDRDLPAEHRAIAEGRGLPALCRTLAERTEAA